jgi:hypothetical protein
MNNDDRGELLRGFFTDPRFKRLGPWLWFGVIDDAKIGLVAATLNPGFFEHALNKAAEDRVLAAMRNGKADEGYTIFAETNGLFQLTYRGHRDAEELHRKIVEMGLQPRAGRYGEFYTLPSSLTMGDDAPI